MAANYDDIIVAAADKYGIDPDLFKRQIKQESGFKPDAVSKKGAIGLGQVMPETAKSLGYTPEDMTDPAKNIDASAKFMAKMYKHAQKNNPSLAGSDLDAAALAAYNAGPGGALSFIKTGDINKLPNETKDYIAKISGSSGTKAKGQVDPFQVDDIIAAYRSASSQNQTNAASAQQESASQEKPTGDLVDQLVQEYRKGIPPQKQATQPAQQPQDSSLLDQAKGYYGAVIRGASPTAIGATLGAAMGAPTGIGAVPGALAGAGAGFLTQAIGDPATVAVNNLFGTNFETPSQALEHLLDKMNVPRPQTEGQQLVQALTSGLSTGGLGAPAAAASIAKTASSPVTKAVASQLAANPALQGISGGAAAGSSELARQEGLSPGAQLAAGLVGGIAAPMVAGKVANVMSAAKSTAVVNPTVQAAEQAKVPLMTSDIVPPETFLGKQAQAVGERVPVIGTQGQRATQQVARQDAVQALAEQYGAPSYEAITQSLKGKVGKVKQAAGRVIDQTGTKLDQAGTVAPEKSLSAIDKAVSELQKPGVFNPAAESQVAQLNSLKQVLSGEQSFSTLKQSRTAVSEILNSVDAAGRSQLPSYAKALMTRVKNAMSDDMKDFAKTNLSGSEYGKWLKANQVYGEEANLLKNSRLKNVLDKGDLTPEVVRNMIYSNKPSENKILYDSLGQVGREQVRAAFINDAFEKASQSGQINPNRFAVELAKNDKKIDIFFKGEEKETVKGLIDVLQRTARAQKAAEAPTTTGATLTPYALGASAFADLGATLAAAVSAGGISRIYESPAVRDLILKMQASKPNSKTEADLAVKLLQATRAADQQTRTKQQKPKPQF